MLTLSRTLWITCVGVALSAGPALAQDAPPPDAPPPAAPAPEAAPAPAPAPASLEERVASLEKELEEVKARAREDAAADDQGKTKKKPTWQIQLRGGWFTLSHNHRNSTFKADDHQQGWNVGLGLSAVVWPDLGPIDLLAHLGIDFRQVAYSTVYTAPITNEKGTINYLNILVAPVVRFNATELVRPFVLVGANIQVASPPSDAISYLDLGLTLGGGIDFKVHERLSVGFDYKYTWLGVADQEDEDFGLLAGYIAFNL